MDAVFYTAAFLASVGLTGANLGIVFYAKDAFNPPPATMGWLAATWCITYAVACLGLRPLITRLAPIGELIASMAILTLVTMALRLAPSLALMFACYALFGLALAFYWPSLMGCLSAGREGRALATAMIRFNVSWCVGAILAPYLCGWLHERRSGLPLLVSSALFALTALLIYWKRHGAPDGGRGWTPARVAATEQPPSAPSTPLRYPAWTGLFASYFGQGVLLAVFPLIGRERYGMPESVIGLILLVRALGNTAGFLGLGALTFWHFRLAPMLVGQAVGVAGFLLMFWGCSPVTLAVAFALVGLAHAMSYSASIFHGAAGSLNRPRRMAIHEACLSAGIVGGSIVGGAVYGAADFRPVYGLAAGVLATSAALQWVMGMRIRRVR